MKEEAEEHTLEFLLAFNGRTRLVGFDNAHTVKPRGSRFKGRPKEADHWHRTENDKGQPYKFKDAETLIEDFFNEVERVLTERSIPVDVLADSEEHE